MAHTTFETIAQYPISLVAVIIVYIGLLIESIVIICFLQNVSCKPGKISRVQRILSAVGITLFYFACICDTSLITIYLLKGDDKSIFYIIHTGLAIFWDLATMILYLFFLHRIDGISGTSRNTMSDDTFLCIFKKLNKANIIYNLVISLIVIQLLVRLSTLTQKLEYIGSLGMIILKICICFLLYNHTI